MIIDDAQFLAQFGFGLCLFVGFLWYNYRMNILVTGASRGIGKVIGERLKEVGFRIFASARKEELLRDFEDYCVCDLFSEPEKLGDYIEEKHIDVLINNAGEYIYSLIDEVNPFQIEHIIKTNLAAPLYLISRAVPYMKEQNWGRIINIGSISGVMGEAGASLYSASKAGLIGASKALALELAEYGITVNTINPGWVETELGNSSVDESGFSKDEMIGCIPQKRFILPEEIAGMIKYLISDEARGVTGQSINLCAGLSVGY